MFLWTQTYGLAESGGTRTERARMIYELRLMMPTMGFHLDRWWGLDRADQIPLEPFFRVDTLATADGGHEAEWKDIGVNHVWSPPAVYHAEAYDGTPQRKFKCDIAFVGSWRHYGHEEWWPVRKAMLDYLRYRYGSRFRCFPRGPAIRGADLNNLYASCKVAVGDSCLSGGARAYFSDRVPETLGRGAALVHPYVEGIEDYFRADEHFAAYPVGDFEAMGARIDALLQDSDAREALRRRGSEHVRASQTYRDRLEALLAAV